MHQFQKWYVMWYVTSILQNQYNLTMRNMKRDLQISNWINENVHIRISEKAHLRSSGVFSTGATGAIAPAILRKRLIAPAIQ
jgi:hypothetical protein